MECGTSLSLRLKTAARLQDAIRSLGKYRRGDREMSEMIAKMEGAVIDVLEGKKPVFTVRGATEAVKSIAQHNNSQCRLLEYGLRESQQNSIIDYFKERADKQQADKKKKKT